MNTVLLVDDDKLMRFSLRQDFEQENFMVLEASCGKRSLEIVKDHPVDIILLDMRLPDGSGPDFIFQIRDFTNAPIIMVSGNGEVDAKVQSFDSGADDYVCKPFDIDELMARVKCAIKRHKDFSSNENERDEAVEELSFGGWVLDHSQFQVYREDDVSAGLSAREFELLDLLVRNAGRVLKREDLCEEIRQDNYLPTARSIDIKVARIRKKLDEDMSNPVFIKTIRGVGYMFNTDQIKKTL